MTTHFEASPEVLISGAGPSGLALAIALARRGVRVEVVEKARSPGPALRAVAIQAGTLELLQRSIGRDTVDLIVREGRQLGGIVAHCRGRSISLELANLPTSFPFLLTLEQSRLEKVLVEALARAGVQVRRGCELVAIHREERSVSCELSGPGGDLLRTGASFLVGCDGPHSFVRASLGVPFAGHADPREYYVADLDLSGSELTGDAHHLFFTREGLAAVFPLPGHHHHRALLVPAKTGAAAANFFDVAATLLPGSVKVGNAYALGHLHFHERISPRLRSGRVFLAGDAAHVNNPAGGQGMNLGLHDASALAPLLCAALRRNAEMALATYEPERLRAASSVQGLTRLLMAGATLSDSFLFRHLLWPAMELRGPQQYLLTRISQLALAHRVIAMQPTG